MRKNTITALISSLKNKEENFIFMQILKAIFREEWVEILYLM